jgi:hypothetical protein
MVFRFFISGNVKWRILEETPGIRDVFRSVFRVSYSVFSVILGHSVFRSVVSKKYEILLLIINY